MFGKTTIAKGTASTSREANFCALRIEAQNPFLLFCFLFTVSAKAVAASQGVDAHAIGVESHLASLACPE